MNKELLNELLNNKNKSFFEILNKYNIKNSDDINNIIILLSKENYSIISLNPFKMIKD